MCCHRLYYIFVASAVGCPNGELGVVARVFEIIGIVAIILLGLITVAVLYFLNKGLKKLNGITRSGHSEIGRELRVSLSGLDGAQGQLDQISAATEATRAGMKSALSAADAALAFLKSNVFQVGVPVCMWLLLLAVTVPRSLAGSKKKKKKVEPIPPPSWQAAAEQQ